MKIKISEVDKMIKEEFQKMLAKKKLSTRLSQVNEELKKLTSSEDSILSEVEAGGKMKTHSAGWSGPEGDVKWKPEFEKKGTHLKEDETDSEEITDTIDSEAPVSDNFGGSEEMETEMSVEMGEFESKFAEIGKAIDAKLASGSGEESIEEPVSDTEMGTGSGDSDDEFEEVEVEDETGSDSENMTDDTEETVQESVEEPLEGHSVAQETSADSVNDNMEKDTHVKENKNKKGNVISEVKKPVAKNIFTEGLDAKKKAALLEEFNRMRKFAGLSREEE